jgi:osmotically inducible lipoprotein OsmB
MMDASNKREFYNWILERRNIMKTNHRFTVVIVSIAMLVSLNGCSNMSARDKSTAIGAGVGAVVGAVVTGGGVIGTVGGAAIGGVIGNQIGK